MSMNDIKANIEGRKQELLKKALKKSINEDLYGGVTLLHLLYNPEARDEANKKLQRLGKWFLLAHPQGRDLRGEPDFTAIKLIRALYLAEELLYYQTKEEIYSFFTQWDFESKYKSENHMLLFHVARYLMAQKHPKAYFVAYKKTGEELIREEEDFIKEFLVFRAKRGWAEFDSCSYAAEIVSCLLGLIDFADSKSIRDLATMALNLKLLDMLVDCLGPLYGGAHGRIYEGSALDHKKSPMFTIYYYYFGHEYGAEIGRYINAEILTSNFVPADYVYDAIASKPDFYENYESKHLHCISSTIPQQQQPQVEGSINKYTYVTPNYIIGAVNFQDPYPENSDAKWYAHHQQHEWDLTLAGGTDIKIFSHHPGSFGTEGEEHGYWTGDLGCCCGQFYCEKNIIMATYNIPENEMSFIHANVPFKYFNVVQKEKYLFLQREAVYISLWFSNGYFIEKEGKYAGHEVKSLGRRHAVICEVGTIEEYQNFADFIKKIQVKPIVFDSEKMTLSYGHLLMSPTERKSRGKNIIFPYPTYQSPIMYGEFDSGIIEIRTFKGITILDFNKIETLTF